MTPEQDELIRRYSIALEALGNSKNRYGPISLLPAPKGVIAAAIRAALAEDIAPEYRNALEAGYCHLADFVPDNQFAVCAQVDEVLRGGDPAKIAELADDVFNRYQAIGEQVVEEMKELSTDLRRH